MRNFFSEFLRRGFTACGMGPVILAILYLILKASDSLETLTVDQVCIGIFSLTFLAFISSGINAIYQIENIPLMLAIFIHGIVLYIGYLLTYIFNDWLDLGLIPVVVFTVIFVIGYVIIWAIIYSVIKKNTKKLNEMLVRKQENTI